MLRFTHGVCESKHHLLTGPITEIDYCNIVNLIGDATDLVIHTNRDPVCADAVVSLIARTGILNADDLFIVSAIAKEMFERVIH
jgi:hypothetical protein